MQPSALSASAFLPERLHLSSLREAAMGCRGCDLYRDATQTVFGEGLKRARIMMVGEQPGDGEDLGGRPFIGPAGRVLDRAIEAAEVDRKDVYMTNVVKHFKFERRGKARIHKRPDSSEIGACLPWLEAEIAVVRPQVVVLLGATATRAMMGSSFRLTRERGRLLAVSWAPAAVATWHPSKVLRTPERAARHRAFDELAADVLTAARAIS